MFAPARTTVQCVPLRVISLSIPLSLSGQLCVHILLVSACCLRCTQVRLSPLPLLYVNLRSSRTSYVPTTPPSSSLSVAFDNPLMFFRAHPAYHRHAHAHIHAHAGHAHVAAQRECFLFPVTSMQIRTDSSSSSSSTENLS